MNLYVLMNFFEDTTAIFNLNIMVSIFINVNFKCTLFSFVNLVC